MDDVVIFETSTMIIFEISEYGSRFSRFNLTFFAHFVIFSSPTKIPCVIYFCSKLIPIHSCTEQKIYIKSLLCGRPYTKVLF